MATIVRGFFRTLADAEQTKCELAILKNIPTIEMQVYDQIGVQPTARTDICSDSFLEGVNYILGISPTSQALLPEGVRRGGPVLDVKADDRHGEAIAEVLGRCGAEDISIFTVAVGQEE